MTTTLEQTLSAHGLHHYWQTVKPLVRNAITLTTHKAEHIPLGASRLGGDPDLPPHIDWPYNGKTPLSFIAQINFAESKPHDHDDRLPASGILYLFYDCEAENWGFDPKDKSGFKVLYYDGDPAALQPRPAPNSDYTFPAASLSFASRAEIPNWSSWLVHDYNWTDEESDAWWEYWETWNEDIRHKLLGHSDNIQGDMELECQLVSHGEYCGDSLAYESERGKTLAPGAADWLLLLQIDSDEDNCNTMWGDSGRLYLWIRKNDLAARTFDKSWLVLQMLLIPTTRQAERPTRDNPTQSRKNTMKTIPLTLSRLPQRRTGHLLLRGATHGAHPARQPAPAPAERQPAPPDGRPAPCMTALPPKKKSLPASAQRRTSSALNNPTKSSPLAATASSR